MLRSCDNLKRDNLVKRFWITILQQSSVCGGEGAGGGKHTSFFKDIFSSLFIITRCPKNDC